MGESQIGLPKRDRPPSNSHSHISIEKDWDLQEADIISSKMTPWQLFIATVSSPF